MHCRQKAKQTWKPAVSSRVPTELLCYTSNNRTTATTGATPFELLRKRKMHQKLNVFPVLHKSKTQTSGTCKQHKIKEYTDRKTGANVPMWTILYMYANLSTKKGSSLNPLLLKKVEPSANILPACEFIKAGTHSKTGFSMHENKWWDCAWWTDGARECGSKCTWTSPETEPECQKVSGLLYNKMHLM